MFEWKPGYSVQIATIDAQHQTLFRIAGELHAAMSAGKGKTAMAQTLERLIQYTVEHFKHEERLMAEHSYPDLATHRAQHDGFTKKVRQFQADFQAGKILITVELLHFLSDWLVQHIAGTDQRYTPYLLARGVAGGAD